MKTVAILADAAISLENAARLLAESTANQNAVMLEINAALGLVQTAAERPAALVAALEASAQLVKTARQYFPKSVRNSDRFALEQTCAQIGTALARA